MDEWESKWRQRGGALMAASAAFAAAWYTATRTFATVDSRRRYVQVSPWGPFIWICVAVFILGTYLVAATEIEALWWFDKADARRREREKSKYCAAIESTPLHFYGVDSIARVDTAVPNVELNAEIWVRNVSDQVVVYSIDALHAESAGSDDNFDLEPDGKEWRIAPRGKDGFASYTNMYDVTLEVGLSAEISCTIRYGFADRSTRWRCTYLFHIEVLYEPGGELQSEQRQRCLGVSDPELAVA